MSIPSKKTKAGSSYFTPASVGSLMIWLIFLSGLLSFWPDCLDRYLAPRFFFLSVALLIAIVRLWKTQVQLPWHFMDVLLLGWYGLNLASLFWSFSWSEGVFYAQKTLLLFACYWFFRQTLFANAAWFRSTMSQITLLITIIVCLILFFQLGKAGFEKSLDNETLYTYATGVFGNKSLAASFLFFLLILNLLFVAPIEKMRRRPILFYGICGILFTLMLMLQVRTALLATVMGTAFYGTLRGFSASRSGKIFSKKTGATVVSVALVLLCFALWKAKDSPIMDRLNPLNYLESATANERRFVWYKTEQLFPEHFWLGVGDGSWKFWMPSKNIGGGYRLSEKNVVFTRAHNDYLEIRAELGITGLVWFCAMFVMAFLIAIWTFRQSIRSKAPDQEKILEISAASTGLLGYCIIQFFDFPRERIEFQVALALLFALLIHAGKDWRGIPFIKGTMDAKWIKLLLIGGLLINLIIGWKRMEGEIHNVRLMEAHADTNWPKVIKETGLAENPYYAYTDAAMPLAWHQGIAHFQLGQFDKAATAFERAYRLNPWSFQVINNYASALVKLKDYKAAIPLFEKALTINPHYDEGKFNLSFIYFQLSDYTQSEAWLMKVDTIANPASDADRTKNRTTLKQLEDFRKVLHEMRK